MKLHEIAKHKRKNGTGSDSRIIEVETYNYGELKLKVSFEYDGDDVDITSVTLASSVEDYEPKKTRAAGTDVSDLTHWESSDDKEVEKQFNKALKSRGEDD